jgi:hypothetical protein
VTNAEPQAGDIDSAAKLSYETPTLHLLGTVEAWTLTNAAGNRLDQSFPAGTPIQDLTFSVRP